MPPAIMGPPSRPPNSWSEGQESDRRADQPSMAPASPDHFVVFADMLGFAALTEAHPIDVRMLLASGRPGSLDFASILDRPKNPLTEAFSRFHQSVKWRIAIAEISHAVTAI